jgi:hypothetical protein
MDGWMIDGQIGRIITKISGDDNNVDDVMGRK